ncbi:MAG: protoheme IX farnesyltransferase [Bacteroidales bacterium]
MTKNNRTEFLANVWILSKARIAIPITLSAATGYLIKKGNFDAGFLFTLLGVFLLACGSMALNQIQEKDLDSRMSRTLARPLPSGKITTQTAWLITLLLLAGGSLILFYCFPFSIYPLVFGWLTIFWYNAVYTPMKRISAFAVVPGSVVGGLPPVIGWLAAGGDLSDHRIWLLAFFFFIGQIPHFWLLILMLGDQYEQAGLPTLNRVFSERQIRRLTFIWIFWSAVVSLFLAFFGVMVHLAAMIILLIGAILIVLLFLPLTLSPLKKPEYKKGFIRLNIFYLLVMMVLWFDSLFK